MWDRYADCNDSHLRDLLASREGILLGRSTIARIRREAGLRPARTRRAPATAADAIACHRPACSCRSMGVSTTGSAGPVALYPSGGHRRRHRRCRCRSLPCLLDRHNARFAVRAEEPGDAYRPLDPTLDLQRIELPLQPRGRQGQHGPILRPGSSRYLPARGAGVMLVPTSPSTSASTGASRYGTRIGCSSGPHPLSQASLSGRVPAPTARRLPPS